MTTNFLLPRGPIFNVKGAFVDTNPATFAYSQRSLKKCQ